MSEGKKPVRVFVGSSKEALPIANAIQSVLDDCLEVTVWNQNVFRPSRGSIKSLYNYLNDEVDVAIIVYSPDDKGEVRNHQKQMARDNVILELGLCVGCLGMERTFIFKPKGVTGFALPSDLSGITTVEYNPARTDNNLEAAVTPGCQQILREINGLAPRRGAGRIGNQNRRSKNVTSPSSSKSIIHPNQTYEESVQPKLTDKERKIIKFLGDIDEPAPTGLVASQLGISTTRTHFHLDKLLEQGFIYDHLYVGRETEFSLSKHGRRFYVENNLDQQ